MGKIKRFDQQRRSKSIDVCYRGDVLPVCNQAGKLVTWVLQDLHRATIFSFPKKVEAFIEVKWSNFKISCKIITGAGNHSEVKGVSVLRESILGFLKSRKMSCYILEVKALYGNNGVYGFEVYLKPPKI